MRGWFLLVPALVCASMLVPVSSVTADIFDGYAYSTTPGFEFSTLEAWNGSSWDTVASGWSGDEVEFESIDVDISSGSAYFRINGEEVSTFSFDMSSPEGGAPFFINLADVGGWTGQVADFDSQFVSSAVTGAPAVPSPGGAAAAVPFLCLILARRRAGSWRS